MPQFQERTFRLLALAGLIFVILLFNGWFLYFNFNRVDQQQALVKQTNRVINEVDLMLSAAKDAETGVRGYIWAKDTVYLEPYHNGLMEGTEHLARLRGDVMADQLSARVVHVAGDGVVAGRARADAREEKQIADAARVRVCADRRGCGLGRGAVVHGWHGMDGCEDAVVAQPVPMESGCANPTEDVAGLIVIVWVPMRCPCSSLIVRR